MRFKQAVLQAWCPSHHTSPHPPALSCHTHCRPQVDAVLEGRPVIADFLDKMTVRDAWELGGVRAGQNAPSSCVEYHSRDAAATHMNAQDLCMAPSQALAKVKCNPCPPASTRCSFGLGSLTSPIPNRSPDRLHLPTHPPTRPLAAFAQPSHSHTHSTQICSDVKFSVMPNDTAIDDALYCGYYQVRGGVGV